MPFLELTGSEREPPKSGGMHNSASTLSTNHREQDHQHDHIHPSDKNQATDPFHKLITNISKTLGPSAGLNTPEIDPQTLITLMRQYTSTASTTHHWQPYAHNDTTRAYTRNLVSSTNPNANILLLVWNPGRSSAIHDHANAHCVMKILQGTLQETLYHNPSSSSSSSSPPSTTTATCSSSSTVSSRSVGSSSTELHITKQTTYSENQVTYISDQIGLHRIHNPSQTDVAVSLHLYTPPHAANFGFNMFDESTGQKRHVQQGTYFSKQSRKCV